MSEQKRVDVGQPWSVAPLRRNRGKHYGTFIVDRHGDEVMKVWTTGRDGRGFDGGEAPSERELAESGLSLAAWVEDYCDNHYECVRDYETALEIVRLINSAESR